MESLIDIILNNVGEPSTLHWLSLFFGEWVLELFNDEVVINYPVTALMVGLSSLSIVAMGALLIVLMYTGGRSIINGVTTADIASGNTKMLPWRFVMAFALLMPTSAGVEALGSKGLSISYAQANVVKIILLGSAYADYVWLLTGSSLFEYNIHGRPPHRDTTNRAGALMKMFLCNDLYQKNKQKLSSRSEWFYAMNNVSTGTHRKGITDPSSGSAYEHSFLFEKFSSLTLHQDDRRPVETEIRFGGVGGKCGSLTLTMPAHTTKSEELKYVVIPSIKNYVGTQTTALRSEANSKLLVLFDKYADFAKRFNDAISRSSFESVVALEPNYEQEGTTSQKGSKIIVTPVNVGDIYTGGNSGDLSHRMMGLADEYIYLTIYHSYLLQHISNTSGCILYENIMPDSVDTSMVSGCSSSSSGGSSSLKANKLASANIFDSYLSGYLSAGSSWPIYQELSGIAYDAERYANSIEPQLGDLSDTFLCTFSIWDWGSDDEFACQNDGTLKASFPSLQKLAYFKASNGHIPDTVTIEGRVYKVDRSLWSKSIVAPTEVIKQANTGMVERVIGLFDTSHMFITNNTIYSDGTMMTSSDTDQPRGLMTGDSALMFNFSGSASPFVFLNQIGEGMRDAIFFIRGVKIFTNALLHTTSITVEDVTRPLAEKAPFSAIAFGIRFVANTLVELWTFFSQTLTLFISALTMTSLFLIYALPAIPVIGWTMIVLGLFYTFISAVAAIPFASVLVGIPKGEGLLTPDTERMLSMLFGIFVRQSLVVIGFVAGMYMAYVGMSMFTINWGLAFAARFEGLGWLDAIMAICFFFVGFCFGLWVICLYSFRIPNALVETVGNWISSALVGAFGSNDKELEAATTGIQGLSGQLNELAGNQTFTPREKSKGDDGGGDGDGGDGGDGRQKHKNQNA